MMSFTRLLAVAALLHISAPSLRAQVAADPSGHWEGAIAAPSGEVRIGVDVSRNAAGQLAATIDLPADKVKGFPLSKIGLEGSLVVFTIPTSGGGTFQGDLAPDGRSMSGSFQSQGGTIPFSLIRTGEARLDAPPTSGPIGKEMEGTWNGTLEVDGGLRLVLKMSNRSDGTSTGNFVSVDQDGLQLPVAILQDAANLTLQVPMVGASYSGALNGAATELVGTYTTAKGVALPLTLRRVPGR